MDWKWHRARRVSEQTAAAAEALSPQRRELMTPQYREVTASLLLPPLALGPGAQHSAWQVVDTPV